MIETRDRTETGLIQLNSDLAPSSSLIYTNAGQVGLSQVGLGQLGPVISACSYIAYYFKL